MTLNLRRLVPIASGALVFWLSGYEENQLSQQLSPESWTPEALGRSGSDYKAMMFGQTAAVEASTLPDPNALYNAAVALGGDAQYTADQAQTSHDWERAAMSWERALNFLKAIPQDSPMYGSAQAKIIDYERRLNSALGQIRRADALGMAVGSSLNYRKARRYGLAGDQMDSGRCNGCIG